jgi:peptidoglycan/xylan/chitin deacetylase (PgdA/CDA1 family)
MDKPMIVLQCWDDGVTADIPLVETLRRHKAKATFNLNAGLHQAESKFSWTFKETEVWRLGWNEMTSLYEGFTIANHSLTHPHLEQIPVEEARREIVEGRERLQQFFQQPVLGFAYPFGSYNAAVQDVLREAGHVYARTTKNLERVFPPEEPMAFHSNCHFLAEDFWDRYEAAKQHGVFYFWGHSYEMIDDTMRQRFDDKIARISADPDSRWGELSDMFV